MFIIFGLAFDFSADPATYNGVAAGTDGTAQPVAPYYQFFIDMLMMAVIGFGFLMAFLRKYAYSAIGFTLLTVAFSFQWALAVLNFYNQAYSANNTDGFTYHNVLVSQVDLIVALYATITVLISFGAVLGVVSAFQLLVVAFFEIILYGAVIYMQRSLGVYSDAPWSPFGFGGDSTTGKLLFFFDFVQFILTFFCHPIE